MTGTPSASLTVLSALFDRFFVFGILDGAEFANVRRVAMAGTVCVSNVRRVAMPGTVCVSNVRRVAMPGTVCVRSIARGTGGPNVHRVAMPGTVCVRSIVRGSGGATVGRLVCILLCVLVVLLCLRGIIGAADTGQLAAFVAT